MNDLLTPKPRSIFIKRLLRNTLIAVGVVIASLVIGMCGYHFIEGMDWVDCYLEAAMILSGMGPIAQLHTTAGKIFAGTYALYSGFTILLTVSIVLAPIVHRFLHKFHVDLEESKKEKK